MLTRKEELALQAEYIRKHGTEPWVKKYERRNSETKVRRVIACGFGPYWNRPISYWPKLPVSPCADCNDAECEASGELCDRIWQWAGREH